MKKRFTEEQIIGLLREAEAGLPIKALCRKHGFSEASYYLWKAKFGGISVPDAKLPDSQPPTAYKPPSVNCQKSVAIVSGNGTIRRLF